MQAWSLEPSVPPSGSLGLPTCRCKQAAVDSRWSSAPGSRLLAAGTAGVSPSSTPPDASPAAAADRRVVASSSSSRAAAIERFTAPGCMLHLQACMPHGWRGMVCGRPIGTVVPGRRRQGAKARRLCSACRGRTQKFAGAGRARRSPGRLRRCTGRLGRGGQHRQGARPPQECCRGVANNVQLKLSHPASRGTAP